jgi:hypothetical protein
MVGNYRWKTSGDFMTSRILRSSFIAAVVIAAMPLVADVPGRGHPVRPLALVTISGVVRDSVTSMPIAVAVVHSGSAFFDRNNGGTKVDGAYTLTVPAGRPILISAEQFSYEPQTQTVVVTAGMVVNFSLTPKATATVRLNNGDTHVLGLATSSFAYVIPFSGYAKFDNANFCKTDGSAFAPSKNDFSKIVGPPTSVNFTPCCASGAVLSINVEMKSGEKMLVYFNDSCNGSEVDFIGRERSTGQFVFTNFVDIAEIDFQ